MFQSIPWRQSIAALTVTFIAGLGAAAWAEKPATTQPAKSDVAYPLKVCIVADSDLGSMGEAYVYQHEGREVKFCCKGCLPEFKENPEKYLKKLDEAEKAATTQPAGKKPSEKKPAEQKKPAADHSTHQH